ncbi:adenine phosphoribosyltransferase [Actinoallomurus vinaceus]|uniref:Adenine phosphoribosyltransferase n=1 Tax=Actinoallomurus vinaceus TaxID=1080074 RepID=A0ABP8UH71_9ACTN
MKSDTTASDLSALRRRLSDHLRVVPDFPSAGILFQDLCGVLAVPSLVHDIAEAMVAGFRHEFDRVVAVEARGFVLGTAVAQIAGRPLVLARKKGKLPGPVHSVEYGLEYGTAVLEMQQEALRAGERALVVDDVLATGGTLEATAELIRHDGADVTGHAVVLDIGALEGVRRLAPDRVLSILTV